MAMPPRGHILFFIISVSFSQFFAPRFRSSGHGRNPNRKWKCTRRNAPFRAISAGLVHAWVGQIVTFLAYRPPSRPLGSLTPTQPGRFANPTQGHPGPPWEAPQAECRSLRREPKPPA